MATVDKRIAIIETKVDEHSRSLDGVREAIAALDRRMDGRFESIDRRFENLERRLDVLDQKLDQRTDGLQRDIHHRADALDQKLSTHVRWVLGTQVTILVAIMATLAAALVVR